jgi:hypothetical protein
MRSENRTACCDVVLVTDVADCGTWWVVSEPRLPYALLCGAIGRWWHDTRACSSAGWRGGGGGGASAFKTLICFVEPARTEWLLIPPPEADDSVPVYVAHTCRLLSLRTLVCECCGG